MLNVCSRAGGRVSHTGGRISRISRIGCIGRIVRISRIGRIDPEDPIGPNQSPVKMNGLLPILIKHMLTINQRSIYVDCD